MLDANKVLHCVKSLNPNSMDKEFSLDEMRETTFHILHAFLVLVAVIFLFY